MNYSKPNFTEPVPHPLDSELASDEAHAALYDLLADAHAAKPVSDNHDEKEAA